MGKAIQIRVDESLTKILEKIRKEVAGDMKRTYGLDEITIHGTLTSQILAARMRGQTSLNFNIRKINSKKGILELV